MRPSLVLRPSRASRLGIAIATLCPLAAAGLQVKFLGFIAPTAMLLGLAALTLVSAALLAPEPETAAP